MFCLIFLLWIRVNFHNVLILFFINVKLLIFVFFTVLTRLSAKWQHMTELLESGNMDDDNTDTQVKQVLYHWNKVSFPFTSPVFFFSIDCDVPDPGCILSMLLENNLFKQNKLHFYIIFFFLTKKYLTT